MSNGTFRVWDAKVASDYSAWVALWERWPEREVFAHPDYVALYTTEGAKAMCASSSIDGQHVLYPFLFRPLATEPSLAAVGRGKADLSSPYGYGGPFRWGGAGPIPQFWREFEQWSLGEGVVSEVIRFSLFPDSLLPYAGEFKPLATNIVRTLGDDEEALWRGFEHKVRKNVNRARSAGVTIEVDEKGERLAEFLEVYSGTMGRRNASQAYYFSREFFEQIHSKLHGQFAYFFAVHESRVVSAELVLVSAHRVYSFLGGTEAEAFPLRPNDLLKFEVMRWAKQRGKQQFVLGGGYEPDDGIYRYKLSFAPDGVIPFGIGCRVFCRETYNELVKARSEACGAEPPRPGFFPEYRA